jgi:hypothetical protein
MKLITITLALLISTVITMKLRHLGYHTDKFSHPDSAAIAEEEG